MTRLLIACALLWPSLATAQAPVQQWPGVTVPIFGISSEVDGGGTFTPQLFGPQNCSTAPAYSFTGAPTSGWGFASSSACAVIGGTQMLGISATAATIAVPLGIGAAPDAATLLHVRGSFSPVGALARGVWIGPTLVPAANADAMGLFIQPTITEAGSGTHAIFASAYLSPPTVNAGAASVTDAATLYIANEPSVVGATNLGLFVGAGDNRIRDRLLVGDTTLPDQTTYLTVHGNNNSSQVTLERAGTSAGSIAIGGDVNGFRVFETSGYTGVAAISPTGLYTGLAFAPGTNPATAGAVRLPNNNDIQSRNAANSANISILYVDGSNITQLGSSAGVTLNPGTGAIKFGSNDVTNAAVGVAGAYKIARGVTALDGSNPTPIATGLTTIISCTMSVVRTTALTSGTAEVTPGAISSGSIDAYGWVLAGTASSGTENIMWVCVGT